MRGVRKHTWQEAKRISKPEDGTSEIIKCEEQKGERMKKSEWRCRGLCVNHRTDSILIVGIPERGARERSAEIT